MHSHTKSEPEILHSTLHTKKFHLHRRAVCTIPSPTPGNLEQAKHGDFLETSDDLVTSYSICVQLPPGGACYLYGCTCTHLIFFGACTIFDKLMIVSSLRSHDASGAGVGCPPHVRMRRKLSCGQLRQPTSRRKCLQALRRPA